MNDEKILDKINEEIVRLSPDNYDAIAEKCRNRADSTNVVPFRKKKNNVRRYLAVAAAFAVGRTKGNPRLCRGRKNSL